MWDHSQETVRAAYKVVEENIRNGYTEALRQSRHKTGADGPRAEDLIHRLTYACVELGVVLVDIGKAVLDQRSHPRQPESGPSHIMLPVTIRTDHAVHAHAVLFRAPKGQLRAWPLRLDGSETKIDSIKMGDGPSLAIDVPRDAAEGVYRGIIVEADVDEPIGAITLRLSREPDA